MKIEQKEQAIWGLYANFELGQSLHVRTGAKYVCSPNHLTKNAQQAMTELCQAQVNLG